MAREGRNDCEEVMAKSKSLKRSSYVQPSLIGKQVLLDSSFRSCQKKKGTLYNVFVMPSRI